MLVFDDVHWAEPTFLDLVEYLEQWSQSAPLLVVCLARPELFEQRPAWGAGSIAVRAARRRGRRASSSRRSPATRAGERGRRIVELAEGNPLFAEQLVALAAEGPDALDSVPPSLEALISSRIDRLRRGERAVLERAAVVGREFWHGAVLHLATPLDVPAVGRHLLELARKGLIRPGPAAVPARGRLPLPPRARSATSPTPRCPSSSRRPARAGRRLARLAGAGAGRARRLPPRACLPLPDRGRGPPDRDARRLAAAAGDRLAAAGLRSAKRGDIAAAANLLGRAAELLPAAEAARRDLLAELGLVALEGGDLERAEQCWARRSPTAVASRDRRAELRARVELAILRLNRDPEGAADELLALASAAIPVFEQLGDDRALGRTWFATAIVHGPFHCRYGGVRARGAGGARRATGAPAGRRRACLQELAAALFYGPTPVEEGIRELPASAGGGRPRRRGRACRSSSPGSRRCGAASTRRAGSSARSRARVRGARLGRRW